MTLQPIARLRLRLTAWYVATFCAILLLLGGGLFLVLKRQEETALDASLRAATAELVRAAGIREMEARSARGRVVDAVDELYIPDRTLFLLDRRGEPVKPDQADGWIRDAARQAMARGEIDATHEEGGEHALRLHAERFLLAGGDTLVAAAVADRVELEDRYASLIGAFGGAAIAALLLVAIGGSILVGKSTAPLERNIAFMRRFMADAAHELRTPLTVLRSRAEVALQQQREPEAYVSTLRGIEAESQRLGRIVEDLLTLARADAGERPIERQRVFLDDLALDAAEAARVVAQAKGVELTMEEFEESVVEGDEALLRQMVMILLDNAVKFTPRGGRVAVRVSAAGGRPTLSVEDTGIGITADQLGHVFERFYRGDPARTRSNGAGLGLSIAQWIATAHDAALRIDSVPDRGTRVSVDFPPVAVSSP